MTRTMLATLVGPSKPDDKQSIEFGDLVRVEIPANCAVYATDPVSARDVARSWFMAGVAAYIEDEWGDALQGWLDKRFDTLWDAGGITGVLPKETP